ncbi:MAG: hypothetical protein Q7R30_13490 [Acidobacteriota bacterium]|nr:hypothetical protein [Acidobacteriota bacterium]
MSFSNVSFDAGPMCVVQMVPSRVTIVVQGTTTIGPYASRMPSFLNAVSVG